MLVPLLFQGVQGSTLVECPKGNNCESKCGEKVLFSLGDQASNRCRYFEPSELVRTARETYKLDKVEIRTFSVNSRVKVRKIPQIYWHSP